MFILGRKNRKFKLGMCYFADDGAEGGAGNPATGNKDTGNNPNNGGEAKFTQDDINKVVSERLASEKVKHEKEMADLKAKMERDAELSKMSEDKRMQAELEDYKKKYEASQDAIALNAQTESTRKMLEEAKLPSAFLNFVLVPKDEKQTQLNINELKKVFESEVKKGVEEQIKPHNPKGNAPTIDDNKKRFNSRSYSTFNLQNSIAEYYDKQK